MRIRLVEETSSARISGARQAGSRKLDPAKTYTVRRRGLTQVDLLARGRRVATFTAPLQVAGPNDVAALNGKAYRGVMEFKPTVFKGLSVTNVVGLDDYLQGVVPAESPASWPAEALRAQAIAARTYAITTAKSADFDHYADTRSQVYGGRRGRAGVDQCGGRGHAWADRHLPGPAGRHVLLLDIWRSHRVGREHDAGERAEAVAGVGRRRVRRRLAAPSLDFEADDEVRGGRSSARS